MDIYGHGDFRRARTILEERKDLHERIRHLEKEIDTLSNVKIPEQRNFLAERIREVESKIQGD